MEEDAVRGAIVLLDTDDGAVYQKSLTGGVGGNYTERPLARYDAVVVSERTCLAFLDKDVELELKGVLAVKGVNDFSSLLGGDLLRARSRGELRGVLLRGLDFCLGGGLRWCAVGRFRFKNGAFAPR